ncbi:MAG: choline dehydrogenase [Myxococcota bacterium]|jgi:choline dehydrogenase
MLSFDTIVIGAGSAGSVIAARLSADPTRRVLLLEAGGTDRSFLCKKPGMIALIHTVPQLKAKYDWGYKTAPRAETLNRKIPYTRGRVLGGSSAINGMVFVRGNRANFDAWAAEGCEGWSFDDVLPLFKKLEDYDGGASHLRGTGGPIAVTTTDGLSPVSLAFQEAVAKTCGVDVLDDYNGAKQEGVGLVQVSAKDGLRYSTSEGYLLPALSRDNLTVWTRAQVLRLILEGSRVVGVVVRHEGEEKTVRADAEVVLSAGAVGTPQILMLSGIGPADHLKSHGIKVQADLPVGENLHDHLFFPLVFLAPRGGHRGTATHFFSSLLREIAGGKTWLGRSVFEVFAFLKTNPGATIPDLQLHSMPWAYPAPNQDAPGRPEVDTRPAFTILPTLIYPESRGEIRLTSANPDDAPRIDPHFLEAGADVAQLMRGIEITREIMGSAGLTPELNGELEPGPNFADMQSLRRELPNRVCTVYHPVGTCRMGVDERAVVDPQLRVRGIEGLRVADASIMPSITGGNTNAPCIMIGEKCAELLGGR